MAENYSYLSATSVFTAYTSIVTLLMVVKTAVNEAQNILYQIIPQDQLEKIFSKIRKLINICPSEETITITIDQNCNGYSKNQLYDASQTFLRHKISHLNKRLKASKAVRDKDLLITIDKDEEILDTFEGISLKWINIVNSKDENRGEEHKSMELRFPKQYKDKVVEEYLPFVLETAERIQADHKVVKLYKLGDYSDDENAISLQHPSTFDKIAMEPEVKRALIDDLDRFIRRKKFYRHVGKVWKRGYLLYGPPGTGKSSLIVAMANYLKFDIYDFDLSDHVFDFRRLLVSTSNRSIIVIEDIDCSTKVPLQNRQQSYDSDDEHGSSENDKETLPLANLLNFIDGLWSSCGDERIIIFTTNYKERLDPALLRPGRMDMHIHLSYLTYGGFKVLASNYLNISSHPLFGRIEELIAEVQITPATVAEELMKSDDVDEVLQGLVQLLSQEKEDQKVKRCNDLESRNVHNSNTEKSEMLFKNKRKRKNQK